MRSALADALDGLCPEPWQSVPDWGRQVTAMSQTRTLGRALEELSHSVSDRANAASVGGRAVRRDDDLRPGRQERDAAKHLRVTDCGYALQHDDGAADRANVPELVAGSTHRYDAV